MCGIILLITREPAERAAELARGAMEEMCHRGPDGEGMVSVNGLDGAATATLGHRRLAIIDLSDRGAQPMSSADGRFVLALNGEIYNYLELRAELERMGHAFRSASDTEVLLAAFAQWGTACLTRLVGMFAFVVIDTQRGVVTMARDPFGMKPLYWARWSGGLAASSEMSPLLALPGVGRQVDPGALLDYLDLGVTDHGAATMFTGVRQIPAAHVATVDLRLPEVEPRAEPYWRPALDRDLDISFEDAAHRMRDLFLESMALHMRSDVRLGAALSGGVDSSAIVMAMRAIGGPSLELHTFTYVGSGDAVNEESWADVVNAAAGAIPHKITLSAAHWDARHATVARRQESPFGSAAIYVQHEVFGAAARAGVKVVLNGQGADELLGGYGYQRAARLASLVRGAHVLDAVRLARSAGTGTVPALREAVGLVLPPGVRRVATRVRGRPTTQPWIDAAWFRERGVLPPPPWRAPNRRVLRERSWRAVSTSSLPALLRYDDRNSMAHSIESRLPFLTPALAELAFSLPESFLVSAHGVRKSVFRAAMRGIVPNAVLDRPDKVGFSVPHRDWLRGTASAGALLAAGARLPGVMAGVVAPGASLRAGGAPDHEMALYWRLVGLVDWAKEMEVDFEGRGTDLEGRGTRDEGRKG